MKEEKEKGRVGGTGKGIKPLNAKEMKEIRGRYLVGRAARSSAFRMIAKREKMQKLRRGTGRRVNSQWASTAMKRVVEEEEEGKERVEAGMEDYNGHYNDDEVWSKGRFEGKGRGKLFSQLPGGGERWKGGGEKVICRSGGRVGGSRKGHRASMAMQDLH